MRKSRVLAFLLMMVLFSVTAGLALADSDWGAWDATNYPKIVWRKGEVFRNFWHWQLENQYSYRVKVKYTLNYTKKGGEQASRRYEETIEANSDGGMPGNTMDSCDDLHVDDVEKR